jgi:uncharacterized protein
MIFQMVATEESLTYADSSALVRIYLDEPHSLKVREFLLTQPDFAATELAYVEVRAALAAAQRAGRLNAMGLAAAKQNFEVWWPSVIQIRVDEHLLQRAADLAEYGSLRGYDAVHLAAAERLKLGGVRNLKFLCFDQALNRSAKMLGIACLEF